LAVRIRLTDGSAFVVDSPFDELHQRIVKALEENMPFIEVRNGNGQLRSINPRQIAVLEETPEDSLTPGEEQVLEAVRNS
jgi:uncharacterized protein YlzI (FlbEa/FlbD family)